MLERVITGGQTGTDQAGWRAAKAAGIPTGGWMPKGFLTEAGPSPEFAAEFGAVEMPTASYPERTRANIKAEDGTVWFGSTTSKDFTTTHQATLTIWQPFEIVFGHISRPSQVVVWIV
jgi:hypothetical protein